MSTKIILNDGALYIDNSTLSTMKCPRLWEYQHGMKRVPSSFTPALATGSVIHLALEHRYRYHEPMVDLAKCESEQVEIIAKFMSENPPPENDHRDMNFVIEIIKQYNERYQSEPFNLLLDKDGNKIVEFPFAVELFTHKDIPVIYNGRLDLPVSWDGKIFLMDNKTKSVLGAKVFDEFRMSPQMLGYCWAFQQSTGTKPDGFAINFIRTKSMTQKMLDGVETKAKVKAWWDDCFYREREYISQWQIDEWKTNAIARIKELFYYEEQGFFPMKQYHCVDYGRCPFYDVCYFPPSERDGILQSHNFKDNDWSPLNSDKLKP